LFYDGDGVFCKYDFEVGPDWELENGEISGKSQYSFKGEGNFDYMVWNMPFELSFKSRNPYGWPQIVITCSSANLLGRETLKGYGVVHVPTQPGRHERNVHIFSPISSSFLFDFLGVLVGKKAEYYWGLGIGDWGLGIGPNPQSPIPNPQSPIPIPQSPIVSLYIF
jgi:B9 domain-containing protein 1